MQYVKTNTAILLAVGPFLDKTDGVTPEVGSMAASVTTLIAETDAGSAPTIVLDNVLGNDATNPVTHITNDDAGYFYLTLTAANLNRLGRAKVCISGPATHCPVFHELMILPAVVYDALVLGTDLLDVSMTQILGTAVATPATAGLLDVNVKEISTDATAANNAELFFDGTGYAGGSTPLQVVLTSSGVAAVADGVCDENLSGHTAANSVGAVLQASHSGACQAGGSGTAVVLASGASSTDDYYNGDQIFGWVTADRTNFFADYISDYVGATRTATVTGIPVSPDATYTYVVLPGGTIPGASAPSADDNAAAVWNKASSGHVTAGTFGQLLNFLKIRSATAQAGGASSVTLDASASATDDLYNYQIVVILSGTGAGQARQITDYVGSTKVATVNLAWAVNPSSDSVFMILPGGLDAATVTTIATGVWAATRAGNATAGSFGEYGFADVVRLSGDATAADNAEAFFDGTGYAGTGNVIPSVTTVTGNVNGSVGSVTGAVGSVTGAVGSVTALAANSVNASALAADAVTEIQSGLATGANLATVDTVVDAIKAKTDSLTFTAAGIVDANIERINAQDIGATKPYNTAT